jgi:hypothetical protein
MMPAKASGSATLQQVRVVLPRLTILGLVKWIERLKALVDFIRNLGAIPA